MGDLVFDATVTDHADALTANGGDNLFEIAIAEAEEAYDLATLELSITPEGGDAIVVEISLATDGDEDGMAGQDDVLLAVEGADNAIDDSHAGTEYVVSLMQTPEEGDPVELFAGTWTAE